MKAKKKLLFVTLGILALILIIYVKWFTYFPIDGTIVDAETKQPIEGAVVLVEWTITPMAWLGMPTTTSYRVIETMSDKSGKFKIKGYVLNPIVNKPNLTIYKAGYVCWNNRYIFPAYKDRQDFKWTNSRKYSMEKFMKDYSYADHVSFIGKFIPLLDARDPFEKAYEWERMMRQKEWGNQK